VDNNDNPAVNDTRPNVWRRLALPAWALALAMTAAGACDAPSTVDDLGAARTMRDSADQVMYGVRSALTSAGLRRGDLVADTMFALDAATRFELRGVRAEFASTLGRPLSVLSAGEGTFWLNRSTVETRGKVTIAADSSGRRIEGAWVRYDAMKNQLASDSPFVATGRGRKLTGVGFTADPGLFTVRCTSRCSGSLAP
jgi:hypothetical protein